MIKIFTLPLYLSLAALIIGAQQPVYFKMLLHSLCPDAKYIRNFIMPNALQQMSFSVIKKTINFYGS